MIFYHFTSFHNLKNVGPDCILAAGLKALPIRTWMKKDIGIRNCVWLTSDPDLSPLHASYSEVRISLVIPSSDRRLVYLLGWLEDRGRYDLMTELDANTGNSWHSFYMYRDDIELNRIRVVAMMLSGANKIPPGAS